MVSLAVQFLKCSPRPPLEAWVAEGVDRKGHPFKCEIGDYGPSLEGSDQQTLPSHRIPFPHLVLPFLADFNKDVVEPVDLLDGLTGISVQGNQNKVLDCCRTESRKKGREERGKEEE